MPPPSSPSHETTCSCAGPVWGAGAGAHEGAPSVAGARVSCAGVLVARGGVRWRAVACWWRAVACWWREGVAAAVA
eukprot:5579658-Prymnesium_polylepis.1